MEKFIFLLLGYIKAQFIVLACERLLDKRQLVQVLVC